MPTLFAIQPSILFSLSLPPVHPAWPVRRDLESRLRCLHTKEFKDDQTDEFVRAASMDQGHNYDRGKRERKRAIGKKGERRHEKRRYFKPYMKERKRGRERKGGEEGEK